jgi:hypothetical protein
VLVVSHAAISARTAPMLTIFVNVNSFFICCCFGMLLLS